MTDDLEAAHKFSIRHKSRLILDEQCGCFYCLKIFSPQEIERWIPDTEDHTAVCPYCGIDSVIGQSSGFPVESDFLRRMREYWF